MKNSIKISLLSTCLILISFFISGCASTGSYYLSKAQLNEIETREVDSSMNETFSAASNALNDAGYTISMSDRQGGLITGTKVKNRSVARFIIGPSIKDITFTTSIQVRFIDDDRSSVRIKTSKDGQTFVNEKAINQIWTLMQRQVLMKEPSSPIFVHTEDKML